MGVEVDPAVATPSIWRTRFALGVDGAKTGARVTALACNRFVNHIAHPLRQGVAQVRSKKQRAGTVPPLQIKGLRASPW